MPPPIIATIASSQLFPISTGGSAYFYPIILDSNGAALSSESNADGNGNSFGHFYKNLLSSSGSLIVSNVLTYCNICNYAGDSTAIVSLWTSNGKYLQVPLVGPTYTTIRKDTIKKEGVVINTISTNNLYSTIMTYGPTAPSNFMFNEGTYSTFMPQNYTAVNYNFSFADATYLNYHKTGLEVLFTTNDGLTGAVTVSGNDWLSPTNPTNYYLNYANRSTNINVWGDLSIEAACSNASGTLLLNLSMCNLAPAYYYRMSNVTSISDLIPSGTGTYLSEATHNTIPCVLFPGTSVDFITLSTQINTYTSGSICVLADPNFSGGVTCNLMYIMNPGDTANAFQYDVTATSGSSNYDRITLGGISNTTTCNYTNTDWHFITTTFSNYTVNYSNFYDFYYYYNSEKKGSFVSNVGHTSSLIGPALVLGQNYPGFLAHLGVFDRCLCKREIELYMDIVAQEFSGGGGGSGSSSGSSSGTGSGGGGGGRH